MEVPSRSSCGFMRLFICCGFFVMIACTNTNNDDDDEDWIDPYDMINYDPAAKRMRKPTEASSYTNVPTKRREFSSESCDVPQCPYVLECMNELSVLKKEFVLSPPNALGVVQHVYANKQAVSDPPKGSNQDLWSMVEERQKKGGTTSQQPTCLPVFKRFLSKLIKETSKLGLPNNPNTVMHYDAEVKLSKQSVSEFQKLLKEDNDWTTGSMDEALSQILLNFKYHDPEDWKWRFEDTFYVEVDTVLKILFCVLIVTTVICTELWSAVSWFIQFKRMFSVCFFISLVWNWFHLYMLAFAEHQKNVVQMESVNAKCTGLKQMDWKDSLLEWYRSTLTLQDDPCQKYYEVLLVNPILLVPPTKAITVTITNFITDPLKHLGQGISEFLRALLKDLPVTLQIPVLVIIAGGILIFMYGSAQAAIQHAIPWPWHGGRRDPPAVEHRQAPQLRDNEDWAGDAPQPLQAYPQVNNHVRNRFNQVFGAGDANANAQPPNQVEIRTPKPIERDNDGNMDLPHHFVGRPAETRTVRVETLCSTGNMSGVDNIDFQQRTQEPGMNREGGGEPDAVEALIEKEKENNAPAKEKTVNKDTQNQDKSDTEPTSNAPSQQIDVKTLGADQGNDKEAE